MLKRYVPFIFVLLWSTGFIGAKYGLPYASTGDFLTIRALANVCVFLCILAIVGKWRLSSIQIFHAMVTGVLIHGAYLAGVFGAIEFGIPAGLTAILVGLQPLFTSLIAISLLKENVKFSQWLALFLGIVGLFMVVNNSLTLDSASWHAISLAVIALAGITFGTLYQKRFCQHQSLLPSVFWQYVASLLVFVPIMLFEPDQTVDWTIEFILSLLWLVFALSVAAILLLMYMVKKGEASKVTTYFYLVPPATAIEAWLLFSEELSISSILGMVLCALSVYIVSNKGQELTDYFKRKFVST